MGRAWTTAGSSHDGRGAGHPKGRAGAAVAAGEVDLGEAVYLGGTGCYPAAEEGYALVQARVRGGAELVVLGTGTPLTNEALARRGNAALALNLLDAPDVRWLRPAPGG